MHTRLQASTDVAAFGIWDRDHRDTARNPAGLEDFARRGQACIVRMGGDCAGAIDVFIDERIPPDRLSECLLVADDRTIVVQSGALVIDGIEYFSNDRVETSSACRLPNGTYRVRVFVTKNEDQLPEPAGEQALRDTVGAEEVDRYDRTNRNVLLGGLGVLLTLPLFLFLMPWYAALPVTLALFIAYFHVQQWLLSRNPRYRSAADRIVPLRLGGERPILVIELSKWSGELQGGLPIQAAV